MRNITEVINESEMLVEAVADVKRRIYQIAKVHNFDYDNTLKDLQDKDWYNDYMTRGMSNAAFSKFMDSIAKLTADKASFDKLIKAEQNRIERTEATIKASNSAKTKAIEDAFGEMIKTGVKIRIEDYSGRGPTYKLSIDDDGTLVFKSR